MAKRICPVLCLTLNKEESRFEAVTSPSGLRPVAKVSCMRSNCEWWIAMTSRCAVTTLPISLDRIYNTLGGDPNGNCTDADH